MWTPSRQRVMLDESRMHCLVYSLHRAGHSNFDYCQGPDRWNSLTQDQNKCVPILWQRAEHTRLPLNDQQQWDRLALSSDLKLAGTCWSCSCARNVSRQLNRVIAYLCKQVLYWWQFGSKLLLLPLHGMDLLLRCSPQKPSLKVFNKAVLWQLKSWAITDHYTSLTCVCLVLFDDNIGLEFCSRIIQ